MELSANSKLWVAIFVGVVMGAVLVKSRLAMPEEVKEALHLRNGKLIKGLLLFIAMATLLFFIGRNLDILEVNVRDSYIWASVFGGVFCGVGLVFCGMSPVTALAATASGRLYAIWTLLGMALAFPLVSWVSELLSKSVYLESMSSRYPPEPSQFFDGSNPALYVVVIMLVLLLLIHFTVGDNEE